MAKNISYFDNLKKELNDRVRAKDRQLKASDEAKYGVMGQKQPGAQFRASKARKNLTSATGQLVGALIQGRRYDAKGNQILASKPKPAKKATAPAMTKKSTKKK